MTEDTTHLAFAANGAPQCTCRYPPIRLVADPAYMTYTCPRCGVTLSKYTLMLNRGQATTLPEPDHVVDPARPA